MLSLAGELADGVCLNCCNPEQIAWSRDRIAEGAARAFSQLSKGLDTALVRVVAARPGVDSVLATMKACRPELVA